ncbi:MULTISPECIES: hypothetical protein [Rodentibacter]|uniref:hypothetical protein n=1 Tax=Rodentibacter TaxID=1960084 RepID=UPI0010941C7A|nr:MULTISPECIES: hypothetical protein [Pasteurellaceae]MCR1838316.1 hypothetical protein [Pasteurella caecimuris]MCU0107573.1 hypothetical protein [Pasteurella caecimuris]NBH76256.1 hypothetical protein [Rodentibacter pneumotropicus]TGY49600.1 hypothetical protein E5343_06340 [Pasteurella caecimuris]THA07167.1 hypothetical protein D3M73_03140 [Rodentibacter pneumotropicus]
MTLFEKIALGILLILSIATAYFVGDKITFSEQWGLYETLRTTASIIFAVVGAWLAIVYPEKLKAPFKEKRKSRSDTDTRFGMLFSPIFHSTLILCIVLFIGILAPILKQIPFFLEYKHILRAISFGVLFFLTFWQIWTVFITLIPADLLKTQSDIEIARQNHIDHLMGKRDE